MLLSLLQAIQKPHQANKAIWVNWVLSGFSKLLRIGIGVGIFFQGKMPPFFATGNVDVSSAAESYMGQVGFKLLW